MNLIVINLNNYFELFICLLLTVFTLLSSCFRCLCMWCEKLFLIFLLFVQQNTAKYSPALSKMSLCCVLFNFIHTLSLVKTSPLAPFFSSTHHHSKATCWSASRMRTLWCACRFYVCVLLRLNNLFCVCFVSYNVERLIYRPSSDLYSASFHRWICHCFLCLVRCCFLPYLHSPS